MKHIFILGGSKEQLDLIFEAKRFYFIIHLFDSDENCYAKKYSDYFYNICISNKEDILKKARQIKPLVVTTVATEIGNLTACYVAQKLGLNTNSYDVAINTTNKFKMKNILNDNNIKTAKASIISKETINWDIIPAIIKPIDSSAGRGISYVKYLEDITNEKIDNALQFSKSKKVLIEEYIKGKQFSIETVSSKGEHHLVAITEEYTSLPPNIIETKQLIPARIDDKLKERIKHFGFQILNAFKIEFGAAHIEIKLTENNDLYVIELASRMGGWRSELINFSLGINYVQLHLLSLLGKDINFKPSKDETAIVKLIISKEDYDELSEFRENNSSYLIDDIDMNTFKNSKHLSDLNGFYFIHIQNKDDISKFIEEHH